MAVRRDFIELFNQWAPTYDSFIQNREAEVFEGYDEILTAVTDLVGGRPGDWVVEVGSGTGNLTERLSKAGYLVVGVEPSPEMRRHYRRKLPDTPVVAGHFLHLPVADSAFRAAVSSYAFHHLTDDEKAHSAMELLRVVAPGGRVIVADIAYEHEVARQRLFARLETEGRRDLLDELEAEYYTTVGVLSECFSSKGCTVSVHRLTDWVWAVVANKPELAWHYEI